MSIQEHLNKIRNAIKGSEVRESIAKGIETAYDDASEKDNANMEVKIARGTHPNLRSRLEEVDNKQQQTTAQLAQKANEVEVRKKINPITLNDFDGETLGVIQDGTGGTPINVESIPRDGSVTPYKTSFIRVYKDLFDKNKIKYGRAISIDPGVNTILSSSNPNAHMYYVPIENGESYTVRSVNEKTYFRGFFVAFANGLEVGDSIKREVDVGGGSTVIEPQIATVENTDNYKYLIVRADNNEYDDTEVEIYQGTEVHEKEKTVVIDGAEVSLNEEVDERFDNFIPKDNSITKEKTTFLEVKDNLFSESNVIDGHSISIVIAEDTNKIFKSSNVNAKLFYVPIENNKTYTVKAQGETLQTFYMAFSDSVEPDSPIERIVNINQIGLSDVTETFTNSSGYKYLLVRADNLEYDVAEEIYIYEGNIIPEDKTVISIENHELALKEDLTKIEGLEITRFKTYYELPEIIKAPRPAPSHQEIYGLYDELVSNKTRYNVEMTVLGTDGQGNELRSYKFSRPDMINDYGFERTKVGIMTGLHGNEKYPAYALHQFMKDLSENEYNNETFERIMTNVDFYIIPIGCPTGWDNDTRQNWNGVNLNRNFEAHWETTSDEDKGSSPASEEETQLIQNWMIDNELDYFTDFHVANMGINEDDYTASWFQINDNGVDTAKDYYRALNLMTNLYSKKYEELPRNLIYGHIKKVSQLSQSNRFAASIGIEGTLLEISEYIKWFEGDIYKVGINWATEMVGNFIIELTRKHTL